MGKLLLLSLSLLTNVLLTVAICRLQDDRPVSRDAQRADDYAEIVDRMTADGDAWMPATDIEIQAFYGEMVLPNAVD